MHRHPLGVPCGLVMVAWFVGGTAYADGHAGHPLHVAPPVARVAPGGTFQFRAVPPPAEAELSAPRYQITWFLEEGPGAIDRDGRYRAPYVVHASGVTASLVVFRGIRPELDSARAVVALEPGVFGDADVCLGEGQTWSRSGLTPEGVRPEELPVAVRTVQAEYPPSARARGLSGGLVVNVLVCRSGHVLDTYASWSQETTPIPSLEEAALEAARQWVFKPALAANRPLATWVAIPFRFPPR